MLSYQHTRVGFCVCDLKGERGKGKECGAHQGEVYPPTSSPGQNSARTVTLYPARRRVWAVCRPMTPALWGMGFSISSKGAGMGMGKRGRRWG